MCNFFDTYKKSDCNGCGACSLRCPKKAIKMIEDEEGFLYPTIDKEKCVNCGLCKKICSNNPVDCNQTSMYIAIAKNEDILKTSASGGMFYLIARYIISKNGIVFGCKYDNDLNAIHDYTDTIEGLTAFQGSKYVRSDLKNSYKKVEDFLKQDRYVLFTGTPCQCAGLRAFLAKKYDKLITCEIICHANASPKIYKMYKNALTKYYVKSDIKNIIFRDKKKGWKSRSVTIIDKNNNITTENSYLKAFGRELINRPSCYECRFCSLKRYSDFTIGDAWGIDKINPSIEDKNTGISLLGVNSKNAEKIFENIKSNMIYFNVDEKIAFSYNHHENGKPTFVRKSFFNKIFNKKINEQNIILNLKVYAFLSGCINKINKTIKKCHFLVKD